MEIFKVVLENEEGQGLVEYGLIISLIVLIVIGAIQILGLDLVKFYSENIIDELP